MELDDIQLRADGMVSHKWGNAKSVSVQVRGAIMCCNLILTPFLLLFHSIRAYLLPCIQETLVWCCCYMLFSPSSRLSPLFASYKYTDTDFPPNTTSLGKVATKTSITWKRAQEFEVISLNGGVSKKKKHIDCLVHDGFNPNDILQGQLGDCWLLSALSSLSNFPETIENAFISRQFNPRGKYSLQLWDESQSKFVTITVDDFIPVNERGSPVFVKPNGNEMWVMILEKAFAKLMGSYASVEGGHSLFALQAITGDRVNKFMYNNGTWKKYDMRVAKVSNEFNVQFYVAQSKSSYNQDDFYNLLASYYRCGTTDHPVMYCTVIPSFKYQHHIASHYLDILCSKGYILCAGTKGKDNTIQEGRKKTGGIVPGHAYTVLKVNK